jgi:hypothetical protein
MVGAMIGDVAEACYGVLDKLRLKARSYLDAYQLEILDSFDAAFPEFRTKG